MTVLEPGCTWGSLLAQATATLQNAAAPAPRRSALWILASILEHEPAQLMAYPDRTATEIQNHATKAAVARCAAGEPVQYVLGVAEFYGLRLRVTRDVLIPRPETEQVVGAALDTLAGSTHPRILDIGTGSGCIALALKHQRPDAELVGCDISERALDVARGNAEALGLHVTLLHADVLSPGFAEKVGGPFDFVISNPPYVPSEGIGALDTRVRNFEPVAALNCGADPLRFYRAIAQSQLFSDGGILVFEAHADYAQSVRCMLATAGFSNVTLQHDWAGFPRIVMAQWL